MKEKISFKQFAKLSLIMAGILGATAASAVTSPVEPDDSKYGLPIIDITESDPLHGINDPVKGETKYILAGSKDGEAAVNVVDTIHVGDGYANNNLVSFAKMKKMASNIFVPKDFVSPDSNGVYVARLYRMTGFPWSWIPGMPDHSHLGRLTFNQVGTQDVWFGDWADVPSGAASGTAGTNYTVFYSGSNPTTNLPASGSATYAVSGINNYVNRDSVLLKGTLTADFAASTLNGSIAKPGLSIAIQNAAINAARASFRGEAVANGTVPGKTGGQFYGDQGAALAGVATFGGTHNPLNTSFGGVKQ